jgi:hypothetical protein
MLSSLSSLSSLLLPLLLLPMSATGLLVPQTASSLGGVMGGRVTFFHSRVSPACRRVLPAFVELGDMVADQFTFCLVAVDTDRALLREAQRCGVVTLPSFVVRGADGDETLLTDFDALCAAVMIGHLDDDDV